SSQRSVVGALVVLGVIGYLLPDNEKSGKEGRAEASSSSGGSAGSASGGSGGSGSADKAGEKAGDKPVDPEPVSYRGIDVTASYELMLADNPPRPRENEGSNVMYGDADFYYYRDSLFGDEQVGSANGKLVVLKNSQKGSLEVCRQETRFTEKLGLDQLTPGSQICVLSKAGHIAVVTYRGKSGAD
ncbi:serine/threonine protein kinase, partial [Streptomyces sp. SID4931]|nr:serine/threonine protein kinase [Streptomyces sp. SID4931]